MSEQIQEIEPAIENTEQQDSIYKELMRQGLWKNNPGIVQLLGLCPLLAVTNTFTNALGLALATVFVLVASNSVISLIRNNVPKAIRIPILF